MREKLVDVEIVVELGSHIFRFTTFAQRFPISRHHVYKIVNGQELKHQYKRIKRIFFCRQEHL